MERQNEIEILMLDRCTRKEAEKHLQNGTIIYPDNETEKAFFVNEYVYISGDAEEALQAWEDMPTVIYNGISYRIMYVL